ncbi:MAG: PAS domain-containing protein, partial [Ignavibacteriae bacterium]|nr:PAS domain-containing protein [Ignavibacteriota bacterium]
MFTWESDNQDYSESGKKNDTVKLNPFTLSFPSELEKLFLAHYYKDSIGKINAAMLVGAIFYSSFFFLDYILVPEYIFHFIAVRFGVTWLIVVLALTVVNKAKFANISQPMIALTAITVASTIIYYIIIAQPKLNNSYYVGIIIVYFWSYSFLKLRFLWASISGVITLLLYDLAIFTIINLDFETVLISNAFLIATNFVGMIISYTLEYYARKDFFQNMLLKKSLDANINLNMKIYEGDQAMGLVQEKLMLQSKALESAANSIVILNKDGNIIWSNNAFSNLTGFSSEEVIGKNPRLLNSGKHDKIFYKNIWSTILNGRVWSGE